MTEFFTKRRLVHLIAGLILSAFFCITLRMGGWCFIPALFAGFIETFIRAWKNAQDWWDFAFVLAGGLIIALFAIL